MTKVEELRRKLDTAIGASSKTGTYGDALNALHCVEPLISAAHAEGVAEGAEQERERWAGKGCEYREGCLAFKTYFPTDASVLAPTKESGNEL